MRGERERGREEAASILVNAFGCLTLLSELMLVELFPPCVITLLHELFLLSTVNQTRVNRRQPTKKSLEQHLPQSLKSVLCQ